MPGPSAGETLQAVAAMLMPIPGPSRASATSPPMSISRRSPRPRRGEGVRVLGPVEQGDWLAALGIDARTEALAAPPPSAAEIERARDRLVSPGEMGRLFKVLAWPRPDWPDPAGFE
jgi:NADH dehydrogenase [ubiquinone] 1 alpha subcomplex assembly factor 7